MKKILFVLLTFGLFSCNKEDEGDKYYQELLPIANYSLPAELKKDSIYTFEFQFNRPTTCHIVDGFYYDKYQNIRKIAIATTVLEQNNCEPASVNPLTKTLDFKPTTESSYVFKIWKGKDVNNQDIFDEIEIPVVP